jgi:signal transduction histidine kinase
VTEPSGDAAPPPRGFVARFTADGDLVEVVVDPLGRLAAGGTVRFADLLDEGSRAKGATLLERVDRDGAAIGWELLLADDPATTVRCTAVDEGGALLVVVDPVGEDLRDGLDPELVRLHRELARRTAQLEEVNEQKNQLIGMAAHDLRNPLGAIRGFAQLLVARVSDRLDEREQLALGQIERASDHLLDLVDDLLQLAEIDRTGLHVLIARAPCDLAALVQRTVAVEQALAEQKALTIELLHDGGALLADVDERKVEQLLANLLSNAVKFSDPGGTITVALRTEGDETVVIEVADQGRGIPAEDLPRIFEPFARTSVRPTAGERSTGLGLTIVDRIVEGHGGRIEVETQVGVGSTFRVLLPRTAGQVVRVQDGPDSSAPARNHPTTARSPS